MFSAASLTWHVRLLDEKALDNISYKDVIYKNLITDCNAIAIFLDLQLIVSR